MLDLNTIMKEYVQQSEVLGTYAREMLKFVGVQQAYLSQRLFPHSNIGGLNSDEAKASMFGGVILSMYKTIKEVEGIDDKADMNKIVDSARLARVAIKEAYEQLTKEPDSLDDESDKLEIKTASAIVNTLLECSELAFHAAKAAACATRVVDVARDAKRVSPDT